MADIFDKITSDQPNNTNTPVKPNKFDELIPPKSDEVRDFTSNIGKGIIESFTRGLKKGTSGILLGAEREKTPKDLGILSRIAQNIGTGVSDIPAFAVGSLVGAPAGPLGSAATAFATPELIKSIRKEYNKYLKSGEDLSLEGFLNHLSQVGKKTGKSALIGAGTALAGGLLPIISKFPGFSKLTSSKLGRAAAKTGLEAAGLTGTQSAIEGRLPTAKEFGETAATLGAFKAGEALASKAAKIPAKAREKASKIKASETKTKTYFELLKKRVGERDVENVKSQFNWRRKLDRAQERGGKFTDKQLEDMIYYRQETGNPDIKGDTFEKVSQRLPEHAKKFVDRTIDNHFKEMRESWNSKFRNKQINPREIVENTYLPHFYEYDPKKFKKASGNIQSNPMFANMKEFLNYHEAFEKQGLKPKYNNIVDIMKAFDRLSNKLSSNLKILEDVDQMQKDTGGKIIVNRHNEKAYDQAKADGFVPFYDPLLRRYTTPEGDVKVSPEPALVEPEFAKAFQGIFGKDPYKTPNFVLEKYDNVSNEIRNMLVQFSPFHYGALTESSVGALGLKGLRFPTLMKEGRNLRSNEMFMREAARAGLKLDSSIDNYKRGFTMIDKLIDKGVANTNPDNLSSKTLKQIGRAQDYLFREFHPNLKATTYYDLSRKYMSEMQSDLGRPLSIEEATKAQSEIAESVNNLYGGQKWETQRFFNNPQNLKRLRRFIGYPDWTVSAIKQGALPFKKGIKGQLGRAYWLKYGIYATLFHGALRWFNSGFKTDKKTGRTDWNLFDANQGLLEGDPTNWYKIPLPDISFTKNGKQINLGRDEKGRRYYMHGGKQALELGKYFREPINALIGKSNPLLRMMFKQVMNGTPWGERLFIEGGTYKYGEQKPWNATDPFTFARFGERAKSVAKDLLPFGVSNLVNKGLAPWALSGAGTLPLSKGLNVYTATPYIEDAIIKNNDKKLNRIIRVLEDNNISNSKIQRRINLVKNSLKRNGTIKGLKLNEQITTNAIKGSLENVDRNRLNRIIKTLRQNGYTDQEINKRITEIEDKMKLSKSKKKKLTANMFLDTSP